MTGIKHDGGKLRYSLLPLGTVAQVVQVLEFGAAKYALDNWKTVPDARTRYFDALMRHVGAWWAGERSDPETGCHHLAHAGCCVLFLLWLDGKHKDQTTPSEFSQKFCPSCISIVNTRSVRSECVRCGNTTNPLK